LLQDGDGNRFMPSFTVKNGKRYRYYFCPATAETRGASRKPVRVPAHDVEHQVCLRLQTFLQSANELMDGLTQPDDPPARTQQIIAAARNQFDQLSSGSPSFIQNFVRGVVKRVVVGSDKIEVEVNKCQLLAAITGDARATSSHEGSDILRLAVEARVKRCGGETRLVVPPHLPQAQIDPTPSLVKVLARAHQWSEWINAGKVSGGKSIAHKTRLDERYVSQILECAFLAPDIVEAILDGRKPQDLTWKKLTRRVPMDWVDQRKQFGFPNGSR
jgi:site-specific DNA recombinase